MVDHIDFKDITVEEVGATSAVLMGAAHHLGNFCKKEFTTYIQKRYETKDPRQTLEEGREVTSCALKFFKMVKGSCNKEFTDYWTCLDENNQFYGECRKPQAQYDECVLNNFGWMSDRPSHISGKC